MKRCQQFPEKNHLKHYIMKAHTLQPLAGSKKQGRFLGTIGHNKFASQPRKRIDTQTLNKREVIPKLKTLLSHYQQQSYSNSKGSPELCYWLSLNLCKVTWLIQRLQLYVKKNSNMGREVASWRSWWTITTSKKTSVQGNLGSLLKEPFLTWYFSRSNTDITPFALGLLKSNFKKHFFFFFEKKRNLANMIIYPIL